MSRDLKRSLLGLLFLEAGIIVGGVAALLSAEVLISIGVFHRAEPGSAEAFLPTLIYTATFIVAGACTGMWFASRVLRD